MILRLEVGHIHLVGEELKKCLEVLDTVTEMLERHSFSHSAIFASYYQLALQYYKVSVCGVEWSGCGMGVRTALVRC